MRRNEFAAGRADFDAAVKIDPKSADALYLRGLSEQFTGDAADSKADITAALALDPKVMQRFSPHASAP